MKRMVLLVALCVMAMTFGYAQKSTEVGVKFNEIVKKYDGAKGVESVTVAKGSGLGLVKTLLNTQAQFGKDFMKGVTSITIVNYRDASPETIQALHDEFEVFTSMLNEFKTDENKDSSDNDYVRCFAAISEEEAAISDFIIAIEDEDTKMVMYMAGKIKVQ